MQDIPWRMARSLSSRAERDRTGLTVAEGPPSVQSAVSSGVAIEFLAVSLSYSALPAYARIEEGLSGAGPRAIKVFRVPDALFERMSETKTPQGILCVLPAPFRYPGGGPRSPWQAPLYLYGVDIQDPGNAGTLVRAAAAAGASQAVFAGESSDVFSPKCIRASAGAVFNVALSQEDAVQDPLLLLRKLDEQGVRLYKAAPRDGAAPWAVDMCGPCAVVVGNEARGLRPEILAGPGELVSIPMPGGTESLNVALASGMILYEAVRQRLSSCFEGPSPNGIMPERGKRSGGLP